MLLAICPYCFVAGSAQTSEPPTSPDAYTLHAEAKLVHADVTVLDKRTHASIENLSRADFRVYDDDKIQPISHFSLVGKDDRPLAVLLLIEVLGYNTEVNNKLPNAARRAFANLRPDDRVAIVMWGVTDSTCVARTELALPFVQDAEQIATTLQRLSDLTPLSRDVCHKVKRSRDEQRAHLQREYEVQNDAIRLSVTTLLKAQGMRRELIAVDQDLALVSRKMADDTAEFLNKSDVSMNAIVQPSFMIGLVKGIAHSADGETYQSANLEFYADSTGGIVLHPKRDATGAALEQMMYGIRAQYSLAWKPPVADGLFHAVRIELPGHRNAEIRARRKYLASSGDSNH